MRLLLHRRVGEDVADVGEHGEQSRERVHADREDRDRNGRERHAEPKRHTRVQSPRRQRPVARARHVRVDVALDVHVERVGAGDDEARADDGPEHDPAGKRRPFGAAREEEAAQHGDQHHRRDARLGERDQVGDANAWRGLRLDQSVGELCHVRAVGV